MAARRLAGVMLVCAAAMAAGAGGRVEARGSACAEPAPGPGYARRVQAVLSSGRDVLGDALLARPGGPSYDAARRLLPPLFFARTAGRTSLTDSGAYYLPFGIPAGARGASSIALHLADGSQIVSRRVGGATLTVGVGSGGRERYGSCRVRLRRASLAEGWLPVLETGYTDAAGARYREESFATRVAGADALVSFVRVEVDARRADASVVVRLSPSAGAAAQLVAAAGAVRDGSSSLFRVARGATRTVYAAWLVRPAAASGLRADRETYDAARASVGTYWRGRLADGMTVEVPEQRVLDAERALLVQGLLMTWRYSVGNPYEQFSFPEGTDVAQVLGEQGFADVAKAIVRTSFTRRPTPYPNWKMGEKMLAAASEVRLFSDRAFLAEATPTLRGYVTVLGRQIDRDPRGLLGRERYSSDIPDQVLGLHSQATVWAGLEALGRLWGQAGQGALAAECRRLAGRLERGLRGAVRASERRLPDGSLFVPVSLLDDESPYASLTESRPGSYWNLVMPYALSSGLFAPGGADARGILRYLELHGSRLLGLVRAGAYALYGEHAFPTGGTDQVYGINQARFLADNGEDDQLDLSLYGMLAAALTPDTFVAGEAASVTPLPGGRERAMYLPPNGAAGAAFLETLRLMLVRETRGPDGGPLGLRLAEATPRAWLRPGGRIAVTDAPTSFGPVSFAIDSAARGADVSVDLPGRAGPRTIELRLRLPARLRIGAVAIDGRPYRRFDPASGTIDLTGRRGAVHLSVVYRRVGA